MRPNGTVLSDALRQRAFGEICQISLVGFGELDVLPFDESLIRRANFLNVAAADEEGEVFADGVGFWRSEAALDEFERCAGAIGEQVGGGPQVGELLADCA